MTTDTHTDTQTDAFEHGIGIGVLGTHDNKRQADIQVNDPIAVSGVLIPEETIVEGGQGVRHFFPASIMERVEQVIRDQLEAETIHIVKNFHEIEGQAPADDIIGELTGVRYSPGIGLLFEGEVTDRDIAEKVANGYLSVSPSIARSLGEFDPEREARPVDQVVGLRDAAIVGRGQPGATVELGPNPSVGTLARDALSRAFDAELDVLRLSEPDFEGYSDAPWDAPTLEETFDGDMAAARNSATWIDGDGETFGDLSLFVVDGEGRLNTNAIDSAWRLASQTDGPTAADVERLRALYERLAAGANEAGALSDDEFAEVWADRLDTDTEAHQGDDGSVDDTQSTDGPAGDASPDEQPDTDDIMSNDTLTDAERKLLAAVDDPDEAIDVLQRFASHEDPRIVEQTEYDTLQNENREAKEAFAALLAEDSPLSADGLAQSRMEVLTEPFRGEDGEIDVDTLRQTPETGDVDPEPATDTPDGDDDPPRDLDTLTLDEREDVLRKSRKRETMLNRNMTKRAAEIEAEICETLGYDDFDAIDLEVL